MEHTQGAMSSADIHIDMSDLSPVLDLDIGYLYGPPAQQYTPQTTTSSEATSPAMTSFDLPLIPDFDNMSSRIYPSPISSPATASPQPRAKQDDVSEGSTSAPRSTPAHKPAPKRKRENRYKNAPPSVLSRRRAQNRASQRAYRERKDQRIRDLEGILEEYRQKHEALGQAYSALQVEVLRLRSDHAQAQSHPDTGMSVVPFGPSPAGPGQSVLPAVDGWQFFPGMTGYSA